MDVARVLQVGGTQHTLLRVAGDDLVLVRVDRVEARALGARAQARDVDLSDAEVRDLLPQVALSITDDDLVGRVQDDAGAVAEKRDVVDPGPVVDGLADPLAFQVEEGQLFAVHCGDLRSVESCGGGAAPTADVATLRAVARVEAHAVLPVDDEAVREAHQSEVASHAGVPEGMLLGKDVVAREILVRGRLHLGADVEVDVLHRIEARNVQADRELVLDVAAAGRVVRRDLEFEANLHRLTWLELGAADGDPVLCDFGHPLLLALASDGDVPARDGKRALLADCLRGARDDAASPHGLTVEGHGEVRLTDAHRALELVEESHVTSSRTDTARDVLREEPIDLPRERAEPRTRCLRRLSAIGGWSASAFEHTTARCLHPLLAGAAGCSSRWRPSSHSSLPRR